jgi:intein/homing endonuclease
MRPVHESELTGTKLKHTIHTEDILTDLGNKGAEWLIQTLFELFETLQSSGKTLSRYNITIKWDGCVSPETPVMTRQGKKPIIEVIQSFEKGEDIEIKARSLVTNEDLFIPLSNAVSKNGTKDWVTIVLEDNREFSCTTDHPIYTLNRGYIPAAELTPEDDLQVD